jgi:hypothetical protein
MTIRWKDPKRVDRIVALLRQAQTVSSEGSVAFHDYHFDEYLAALVAMAEVDPSIPEGEGSLAIRRAIFDSARAGSLETSALLKAAKKRAADYLRRKPRRYTLVTSISVELPSKPIRRRALGGVLSLAAYQPEYLSPLLPEAMARARSVLVGEMPRNYPVLLCRVEARCEASAFEIAMRAVDFIRGLWNFFYNRRLVSRTTIGKIRPVNGIVLGPVHALHDEDATTSNSNFWWEPAYRGPLELKKIGPDYSQMNGFELWCRQRIDASARSEFLIDAIVRYVRALDDPNLSTAFLRLWGVLEDLTGKERSYDLLIRRASFLHHDEDLHRILLDDLRERRNLMTHRGKEDSEPEEITYRLKRYVEVLMRFYLSMGHRFRDGEEMNRFLDLPPSGDELQRELTLLKLAHKLHSVTPGKVEGSGALVIG